MSGQELFGDGDQVIGEVASKDSPQMEHEALLARRTSHRPTQQFA